MAALSGLALLACGLLALAEGGVLLYDPAMLFSAYGRPALKLTTTEGAVLLSLARYFGASLLTFGFLFVHLILHAEKHSAGLRTAAMFYGLCTGVAGYRYYEAGLANDMATRDVALKSGALLGAALVLSVVGMLAAPKSEKSPAKGGKRKTK